MFYCTICNISPKYTSNLNMIQLFAITKTQHVKKHGLQTVLEPFISDMQILKNDGISVVAENGEELVFKGSLLFISADTPAAAAVGEFKESVAAFRFCRSCMATSDNWTGSFRDSSFQTREINIHREHCRAVTELDLTRAERTARKRHYGVNSVSSVMDVCDVTQCLPQDIMHIWLKGVCEVAIRAYLRYLILERELFDIEDLNDRIESFNFSCFSDNKPGLLHLDHIGRQDSLKQTASQIKNLLHTLPFLISDLTEDEIDENHVLLYTLLLQITNILFAYEIHENTIFMLERMIEIFCLRFNNLYPDTIVPKFHFLIHIIRYLRLFGPLPLQSCMCDEAKHSFFRSLFKVLRNVNNLPYSLSSRHQARLSLRLSTYDNAAGKSFLYQGHNIEPGNIVYLNNLRNRQFFYRYVNEIDRPMLRMMRSPQVECYGTTYKKKGILLLEISEIGPPTFGIINNIFVFDESIVFSYTVFESDLYDENLNAYKVIKHVNAVQGVISLEDLIFPHSIPVFVHNNFTYVLLINHEFTEFYG